MNIIYPKCFKIIEASRQSAQDIIDKLDILSQSAEKMRSDLIQILRHGKINE